MSELGHHAEWLSLIDVSGPFLAEPVLKEAFPQGLEGIDTDKRKTVRQAYDEWREAQDLDDPDLDKIHRAWTDLVLRRVLELDENNDGEIFKAASELSEAVKCELPEHGITLRPDFAVVDNQSDSRPILLISVYEPDVPLGEALKGDVWPASPAERMVELCRATNVRLGLVSNGEQWMLVDAPIGATTSLASWYAKLWSQEPRTLQAFVNLLGVRRHFLAQDEQLPALLDKSLTHQDEVTDALGEQVRRAVEVLIQALDRADVDRNRELLDGVEPAELYEAGLTVMMRIVFLLSAEERGLLLLGDERYEANYAVSTLRMQLRGEPEEVLERRWDAWSRLLSIFRAVYGGVDHDAMRLPALGGSLFDPDRFPFLEGRRIGSRWKVDPAAPVPIDNRTVLYLLDAVQLFEGRALSYLALDVEQIGYAYEGLLERTVARAEAATLDLVATKSAIHPWVSLPELEEAAARGRGAVEDLLRERTGSSPSRIRNDLNRPVDEVAADQLLTACHGDEVLRDRVKPYCHLLRTDRWGYPLVYPQGAFMVASGSDRRETGTHYTPKSLTETIVKETLEPIVYVGPIEGKPREEWSLKSFAQLLDLKICDPAMGSGAFLVQVCRWLSERVVEAWARDERQGKMITSEGEVVEILGSREPLRKDGEERLLVARRMIAERCIYGVDMNPLAVELAKLSIWLVTLAKGRPFGFLDHNLRCGDSLLGLTAFEQLEYLNLAPAKSAMKMLFASKIEDAVSEAIALRSELRRRPIRDIRDVEAMAQLDEQARQKLQLPDQIADALVGNSLAGKTSQAHRTEVSIEAGGAMDGNEQALQALEMRSNAGLSIDLSQTASRRRPLHWPLVFPEVFQRSRSGFDAVVGNPPFRAGRYLSSDYGASYRAYLQLPPLSLAGQADLCAAFCARGFQLIHDGGFAGFIATNTISEGDTREAFLSAAVQSGGKLVYVQSEIRWPGKAQVVVSPFVIAKAPNAMVPRLNHSPVNVIDTTFSAVRELLPEPRPLALSRAIVSKGVGLGQSFFRVEQSDFPSLKASDPAHVRRFITGTRHNAFPDLWGGELVFWFEDIEDERTLKRTKVYSEFARRLRSKAIGTRYWRYRRGGAKLYAFLEKCKFCVVRAQTSSTWCFSFMDKEDVFDQSMIVFGTNCAGLFAVLHSSLHEVWVDKFSRSMKTDTGYSPSECFHNFPLPYDPIVSADAKLAALAIDYSQMKLRTMNKMGIGNTELYSKINAVEVQDAPISLLRQKMIEVDQTVLEKYGWSDVDLKHDFREGQPGARFTISREAEEEVIHRLQRLNIRRHESEADPTLLLPSASSNDAARRQVSRRGGDR